MAELKLISIKELLELEKSFFIPSYQRGYRWKKRQVIDLLDDILEFQKKKKDEGEFYCLQPLAVTKNNDKWEVIDGQQRLTTLYIILSYLIKDISSEIFSISYETRNGEYSSKNFLKNIRDTICVDNNNVDFYHMSKAFLTIKEWFEKKDIEEDFLKTLLKVNYQADGDNANNIRFIWYEAQKEEDAKSIFTRINMGKIPLTNAELIKALFFINGSQTYKQKEKYQNNIAYEWDNIEKTLQNNNFWFFLNKSNNSKATKIEFIFDLIANKYQDKVSIEVNKGIDKYYTFYIFNSLINEETKTKDELWKEVKTYFRTFEEWYNNNEYYHLIGYLIHIGKDIGSIKKLSNGISKSEFKEKLYELIKKDIQNKFEKKEIKELIELSYQDNRLIIRDLLLLFNVISTMNSKYTKFPFKLYIKEKWSLEHIHAQNSEDLKTDEQIKSLLEEQEKYFQKSKEEDIIKEINKLLKSDSIEPDNFIKLQKEIFKKYTEDDNVDIIHSIDNLALLSSSNNSALSNNIFPIKRDKLIELDKQGFFIPLCTKNVFLKYYSKDFMQNTTWTKEDRDSYLTEIIKTLKDYLPNNKEKANGN